MVVINKLCGTMVKSLVPQNTGGEFKFSHLQTSTLKQSDI